MDMSPVRNFDTHQTVFMQMSVSIVDFLKCLTQANEICLQNTFTLKMNIKRVKRIFTNEI